MSAPTISLPQIECPGVLLPTPANLRNLFAGLASYSYKNDLEDLKKQLEDIRKLLTIYDPNFEKIEIPELEWEIIITRLSAEYPMYVQRQILELINDVFTIEFNVTILGITFDILEFLSNPNSVLDNISLDQVDSIYDLIPEEYKVWNKFETADFKKESIRNFLRSEVAKNMNILMHGGFSGLIGEFGSIWDELDLGAPLPGLLELDLESLIRNKSIDELKSIQIFTFTLYDLLGGEFNDNVEIPEFEKERLLKRAREFAEEWQTYQFKLWMQKVTEFFDAIGLGDLTQWITFDFCDFLTLIGFPKTIDLPPSVQVLINNTQSPLPNTTQPDQSSE